MKIVIPGFGMVLVVVSWIALRHSEPANQPKWRKIAARIALTIFLCEIVALSLFAVVAERTSLSDYVANARLLDIALSVTFASVVVSCVGVFAVKSLPTKSLFAVCGMFWTALWALSALSLLSVS